MLYKDENGDTRILKPLEKRPTINAKNREYWRKRTLSQYGKKYFFPTEIKTGVCYFCKKDGMAQKSRRTALHHLKYDKDDPLKWTIELCNSCHSQVDPRNRKIIQRHFAPRDFAKAVDREAERIVIREYYSRPIRERLFEEQKKRENMLKERKTSSYNRYM